MLTGAIIWAACRPIVKILFLMSIGFFVARKNILTSEGSKIIANLLIWVIYPCLLFANVVGGIDSSNFGVIGIMTIGAAFCLGIGLILGVIILKITNPPIGFRYGTVMATAMGNHGDLVLAIILSLGESPPFNSGDSTKGVAFVSAFLLLMNLFFFSLGYFYFGEDARMLAQHEEAVREEESQPSTVVALQSSESMSLHARSKPRNDGIPLQPLAKSESGTTADFNSGGGQKAGGGGGSSEQLVMEDNIEGAERLSYQLSRRNTLGSTSSTAPPSHHAGADSLPTTRKPREMRQIFGRFWWTPKRESTRFFIKSLGNLANIATVLGLIIAAIPPAKALFYRSSRDQPEPPLSFIDESFQFLGQAAVPMGLINLGAALGRLNVKSLISLKIISAITITRLIIMPLIGIGIVQLLLSHGVLSRDQKMLQFVLMIEAAVPTASSTVFFTQMWHPRGEANAIAGVIIVEYTVCIITMSIALSLILSLVSQ